MSMITQLHSEFLKTSTHTDLALKAKNQTSSNLIFLDLAASDRPNDGMLDIDDILASYESDMEAQKAIINGRHWLAESAYSNERSVRKFRLSRGWSQSELALKLGTSQSHVARIESGKVDLQTSTILKLADVFNVAPQEMFIIISSPLVDNG